MRFAMWPSPLRHYLYNGGRFHGISCADSSPNNSTAIYCYFKQGFWGDAQASAAPPWLPEKMAPLLLFSDQQRNWLVFNFGWWRIDPHHFRLTQRARQS